jgi:hypothetical protein
MKRSRFSEEQIVGVLKDAEAGVPMKDLCRRIGISDATFYHWKLKSLMPGTNHSLLESTRELYRGAETTTLCVRWSTTTYSPGGNPTRSLMRQFADSRSFTASNQRKLPLGSFFRISKGECTGEAPNAIPENRRSIAELVRRAIDAYLLSRKNELK